MVSRFAELRMVLGCGEDGGGGFEGPERGVRGFVKRRLVSRRGVGRGAAATLWRTLRILCELLFLHPSLRPRTCFSTGAQWRSVLIDEWPCLSHFQLLAHDCRRLPKHTFIEAQTTPCTERQDKHNTDCYSTSSEYRTSDVRPPQGRKRTIAACLACFSTGGGFPVPGVKTRG